MTCLAHSCFCTRQFKCCSFPKEGVIHLARSFLQHSISSRGSTADGSPGCSGSRRSGAGQGLCWVGLQGSASAQDGGHASPDKACHVRGAGMRHCPCWHCSCRCHRTPSVASSVPTQKELWMSDRTHCKGGPPLAAVSVPCGWWHGTAMWSLQCAQCCVLAVLASVAPPSCHLCCRHFTLARGQEEREHAVRKGFPSSSHSLRHGSS